MAEHWGSERQQRLALFPITSTKDLRASLPNRKRSRSILFRLVTVVRSEPTQVLWKPRFLTQRSAPAFRVLQAGSTGHIRVSGQVRGPVQRRPRRFWCSTRPYESLVVLPRVSMSFSGVFEESSREWRWHYLSPARPTIWCVKSPREDRNFHTARARGRLRSQRLVWVSFELQAFSKGPGHAFPLLPTPFHSISRSRQADQCP